MKMQKTLLLASVTTLFAITGNAACAGVVSGWNLDNVVVDSGPYVSNVTYFSTIYDRDVTGGTAGASTNGTISFEPPEGAAPGLKVMTGLAPPITGQAVPNCIMAAGAQTCQSEFQSGKRFKMQARDIGPIDLSFDASSGEDTSYRVFEKLSNATGGRLGGFTMELGFGIGDNFVRSTNDDGLGFDLSAGASTNFAFGLFGDADTNPNFTLDGFFDTTSRAGFNVDLTEDMLNTLDLYGSYQSLFGYWLGKSMVPDGYFIDHDSDPTTDAILIAYQNEDGDWIQQRVIDSGSGTLLDPYVLIPSTPTAVTEQSLIDAQYDLGLIDDLANLNVNYNILVGDISGWSTYDQFGTALFTLRLTPNAVPEPASAALLGISLAMMGWRRRKLA